MAFSTENRVLVMVLLGNCSSRQMALSRPSQFLLNKFRNCQLPLMFQLVLKVWSLTLQRISHSMKIFKHWRQYHQNFMMHSKPIRKPTSQKCQSNTKRIFKTISHNNQFCRTGKRILFRLLCKRVFCRFPYFYKVMVGICVTVLKESVYL